MKKIALIVATAAIVTLALSACTSTDASDKYSADTVGDPAIYAVGDTLPNDDGTPIVTAYRTNGEVAVKVLLDSDSDASKAPSTTYESWSGGALERGKFATMDLLTDDQLDSLRCILEANGPYPINFTTTNTSNRYIVTDGETVIPSRNENDLGLVINPDCTVQKIDKATVSGVYLVEVN